MRGKKVFVPAEMKEFYEFSPEDRRQVTIIEGVCADGSRIPGMCIVAAALYQKDWFNSQQTGDELIGISDSGYTNEGLGLYWLEHFIRHLGLGKYGTPDEKPAVILLMDSHSSHCGDAFKIMCQEYNIIRAPFIPHSTHFIQPLDVKVFNKVKGWHSKCVRRSVRQGESYYNIVSFMWDLPEIREEALDEITIQSGFSTPGLWPYDEKKAIDSMKVFEADLPPSHLVRSNDPVNAHDVTDTLKGLHEIKTIFESRPGALSSSPTRRLNGNIEGDEITLRAAHLDSNAYEELKQGLRTQQKRKIEWIGGTISGEIKVLKTGEALKLKNDKVAQKREEKATKRQKAIATRANVVKRRRDELEVKIRKRMKAIGPEAVAKAVSELEAAEKVITKVEQQ